MSLIPLGFWAASAGGAGGPYWISALGSSGDDTRPEEIALDSLLNSYAIGITSPSGSLNRGFLLVKRDLTGAIQWQRKLSGVLDDQGKGIAIDSSDNVLVVGHTSTNANVIDAQIAKYNSAGTLQWQKRIGGSSIDNAYGVSTDASDNLYIIGEQASSGAGSYDCMILKYNSSGTLQWQKSLGGTGQEDFKSVKVDSSGNSYALGTTNSAGAGGRDIILAKYDSSGTIQWQRFLGGSGSDVGYSVALDSSDNVYLTGYTNSTGAGNYDALLAKFDSSGTLQWQKTLGSDQQEFSYAAAIDSNNNFFILAASNVAGAGYYDLEIAKFDSAGILQWQRSFSVGAQQSARSIAVDSVDDIYILGQEQNITASDYGNLTAKLPNNGSLTGTYVLNGVSIVYSASSLTVGTGTLTSSTGSLTNATSSLTSSTSTLTSATATQTSFLVEI